MVVWWRSTDERTAIGLRSTGTTLAKSPAWTAMLGASFFRWRGLTTIPPLTPFLSTWSQCGATITKAYGWSPRWRPANTSNFCDGSDWPRCVLSALWGMCRCFAYPRPAGMNPRSAGYVEPGQVELPRPLMVCPRLWQTPLSDWLMRWNRFLTLCLTVDDSLPQLLDRRRVASVLRLFPGAAHIQRLVADRLLFGRRLHAFECRLRVERDRSPPVGSRCPDLVAESRKCVPQSPNVKFQVAADSQPQSARV